MKKQSVLLLVVSIVVFFCGSGFFATCGPAWVSPGVYKASDQTQQSWLAASGEHANASAAEARAEQRFLEKLYPETPAAAAGSTGTESSLPPPMGQTVGGFYPHYEVTGVLVNQSRYDEVYFVFKGPKGLVRTVKRGDPQFISLPPGGYYLEIYPLGQEYPYKSGGIEISDKVNNADWEGTPVSFVRIAP